VGIFEILLILVIALIVIEPEQLPSVLRATGRLLRDLRLASNTMIRELTDALEDPRYDADASTRIAATAPRRRGTQPLDEGEAESQLREAPPAPG
jgi:Sec-independent protein translocase protein TatA